MLLTICNFIITCLLLPLSSSSSASVVENDDDRTSDKGNNNNSNSNNNKCLDVVGNEEAGGGSSSSSSSCIDRDSGVTDDEQVSSVPRVSASCELVLAETQDTHEWAVYTMVPRSKGTPVRKYGDIVIQWTDPIHHDVKQQQPRKDDDDSTTNHHQQQQQQHRSMYHLKDFTWNGQETGGHYEGHTWVESVVPGLGMLSRSRPTVGSSSVNGSATGSNHNNILPLVPRVDEGGLTRFESPGAGAITYYNNFTWWYFQDVEAGDELFYSLAGKLAVSSKAVVEEGNLESNEVQSTTALRWKPTLDYLRHNGYCIDNILARQSRIKEAGRGAFAARNLPEGSIVAPVPVAMVKREDLVIHNNNNRKSSSSNNNQRQQLLLNYCFGSKSSSWLFFPYSPIVNLINHYHEPNVKLRLSSSSKVRAAVTLENVPPQSINMTDLLLELVATRPIQEGEEIYLDYGRAWEDAWWNHVNTIWRPINQHYSPSYVMDDAIRLLRTEQEQKDYPYPDNVFTSCFYRYSDRSEDDREIARSGNTKDSSSLTSFRWHLTRGLYDLKNLRPCQVLKRLEDSKSGRSAYAVRMLNRPNVHSMDLNEIIPSNELHIVTHVPRAAVRFSDKGGTTDPHLPSAFRHEIGLPDGLLPAAWQNIPNE
jgi:hypothetical protein